MTCEEFEDRILNVLLPEFCNDPSRGWGSEGFKRDWDKIYDADAQDFLRALDTGIVKHIERGLYSAAKSSAKEQFFWSGLKHINPRPITLWAEPIITVAVLGRLHFNYAWPKELLGAQSSDWAFDVVAFRAENSKTEYISCEVKKSNSELERLIIDMIRYGKNPALDHTTVKQGRELNSYRKVRALRLRRAPLFWAVGPNNASHVFKVEYGDDGLVTFEEVPSQHLRYNTCEIMA